MWEAMETKCMLSEASLHQYLLLTYRKVNITKMQFSFQIGLLIFGGECFRGFPSALQVFTPEWFLMALLVDWESLEMCVMYWVFLEMIVFVPIVLRVLVSFVVEGRVKEEDDVLVVNGK